MSKSPLLEKQAFHLTSADTLATAQGEEVLQGSKRSLWSSSPSLLLDSQAANGRLTDKVSRKISLPPQYSSMARQMTLLLDGRPPDFAPAVEDHPSSLMSRPLLDPPQEPPALSYEALESLALQIKIYWELTHGAAFAHGYKDLDWTWMRVRLEKDFLVMHPLKKKIQLLKKVFGKHFKTRIEEPSNVSKPLCFQKIELILTQTPVYKITHL